MVVGHGVDSSIDGPYEERAPATAVELKLGQDLCIVTGDVASSNICGEFHGIAHPTLNDSTEYVLVDVGTRILLVPRADIRRLDVEVGGYGWAYGGAVGLPLDVAALIFWYHLRPGKQTDFAPVGQF
jgi:hypothetical protein